MVRGVCGICRWTGNAFPAGNAAAAGGGVRNAGLVSAARTAMAQDDSNLRVYVCWVPAAPDAVGHSQRRDSARSAVVDAQERESCPDEVVPDGFMAWEKTWLYRMRDTYAVTWKLNDEEIQMDDIPARAFDTPEEKERVAMLLEPYNEDTTFTAEEDAGFAQLAKERTARHPLRTYLWIPLKRASTIWLTPRIELLPYSGNVFPLAYYWEDDPVDQSVTIGFAVLNVLYLRAGDLGSLALVAAAGRANGAVPVGRVHRGAHGFLHDARGARAALCVGVFSRACSQWPRRCLPARTSSWRASVAPRELSAETKRRRSSVPRTVRDEWLRDGSAEIFL